MKVLSEQRRSSIRKKLVPVMGDDDAHAMIEALPSEGDDIVTKDFLKAEFAAFGENMEKKFVTKDFLRAELGEIRTEMAKAISRQTVWLVSALLGGLTVSIGASASLAVVVGRSIGAG